MIKGEARRVAFFGGSFDPPHPGHLAVARAARDALQLDLILFAPVGAQPLKPQGSTASFDDRLRMTKLAVAGEPGFEVSPIDAPDPAGLPNYTLDTLRRLHALYSDAAVFCLMGADSFLSLRRWHGAAEVPFAATLVVASRPGQGLADLESSLPQGVSIEDVDNPAPLANSGIELLFYTLRNHAGQTAAFYLLPGLDIPISASKIRRQIRRESGDAAERNLLSPAVSSYIRERGLYQER